MSGDCCSCHLAAPCGPCVTARQCLKCGAFAHEDQGRETGDSGVVCEDCDDTEAPCGRCEGTGVCPCNCQWEHACDACGGTGDAPQAGESHEPTRKAGDRNVAQVGNPTAGHPRGGKPSVTYEGLDRAARPSRFNADPGGVFGKVLLEDHAQ